MGIEWLLCVLLLAAVGISFLSTAGFRSRWAWGLLILTIGLFMGAAVQWRSVTREKSRIQEQILKAIPRADRNEEFVSSDSCQACHPSQYASWHQSFHRTMTQVATPESVKGNFDHVKLEQAGVTYQLGRSGSQFWVDIFEPASAPKPGERLSTTDQAPVEMHAPIAMLTGSHHQQVYWISTGLGNRQMALPFTYLLDDQRWVPGNDSFLKDPHASTPVKMWNLNCIECHATGGQPRPVPKSKFLDSRVGELGIACEACHGPAVEHVRANHNPARRYHLHGGKPDPTIVNPGRLSAKLSSQACGQCHGIKWLASDADWNQNGFRYRPGEDLTKASLVVRPTQLDSEPWMKEHLRVDASYLDQRFWADGMVRVSGREYNGLVESPCHQRGELSCLSCHSLHQSLPEAQLASRMESNEACLQCHKAFRDKIESHTHHQAASSGSQCYNCHMPYTTYGLLKAIRSHQIDSPDVRKDQQTGRPNACNLCHMDQPLAWTAKYLNKWYGRPQPEVNVEERTVSDAVSLLLRGDAGQRALIAWSMGWEPAQTASGESWLPFYLAQLLEDPYSAVRYIAARSLRTLPPYKGVDYDFIGSPAVRQATKQQVLAVWNEKNANQTIPAMKQILMDQNLAPQQETIDRLLKQRNDRHMDLQE